MMKDVMKNMATSASVSEIGQKCDRILQSLTKTVGTSNDQVISHERDVLFRSGRGIATLQAASEGHLLTSPANNMLYCDVCASEPNANDAGKAGVFQYEFSIGSEFPSSQSLPPKFKQLRNSVKMHFTSASHAKAAALAKQSELKDASRMRDMDTVAHRVLRVGYYVLINSLPREKFEELVVLLHASGVNVGDKNHSAKRMENFRDDFHEEMIDMMKKHVASQPCVAVTADKITLNRRTVDITAIFTVVPDAPPEHLVQVLAIGAPVVKEHDGESIARELQRTLALVGIESAAQVASFSGDGQYHHASVPQRLTDALNEAAGVDAEVECINAVWDTSHLMQLAEKDARQEPANAWVQDIIVKMTDITKRFSHGKGLEDLMDEAADDFVTLKLWSNTRFAAHAAKSLRAFRSNGAAMLAVLRKRFREEKRMVYAQELWAHIAILEGKFLLNRGWIIC